MNISPTALHLIKSCVYIVCIILSFFALEAINFQQILKNNKPKQAILAHLLIAIALGFIVGSFLNFLVFDSSIFTTNGTQVITFCVKS